jgi:hypothetical protein
LKKSKISIFGGISKFCLWANFYKFWQFWAKFATLTVAQSMPEVRLKSSKPSSLSTMNPIITWRGSLESYHPYLTPQKVSKNPQTYCVHNTLPNVQKPFLLLRPLGVK